MNIPDTFLIHASDVLADTVNGMSGGEIVKYFKAKAIRLNIDIPHNSIPFQASNKRTAFYENLVNFQPTVQFEIISELTENSEKKEFVELRKLLYNRYSNQKNEKIVENDELTNNDSSFKKNYPNSYAPYSSGIEKYNNSLYERNLLDDMRLALELLLKQLLSNNKSLENQIADVGIYCANKGISKDAVNMLQKLVIHYGKYQNEYVKHNDKVNPNEIEFIINLTTTFIKLLIKV